MFHMKDMIGAAKEPPELTFMGKTLQDQLLYRKGNR